MNPFRRQPGPRYGALLELLRTADALWNRSREFFVRFGLTPSQFNVLNLIFDRPAGLTQIELSRALITHRSNITGLVDRLEARGWVRRHDLESDRRAYCVCLTAAGRRLMETVLPAYYDAAEQVWGEIPIHRAQALRIDLGRLTANAQLSGAGMVPRAAARRKARRRS